jgi:hypothetical protein
MEVSMAEKIQPIATGVRVVTDGTTYLAWAVFPAHVTDEQLLFGEDIAWGFPITDRGAGGRFINPPCIRARSRTRVVVAQRGGLDI